MYAAREGKAADVDRLIKDGANTEAEDWVRAQCQCRVSTVQCPQYMHMPLHLATILNEVFYYRVFYSFAHCD